MGKKRSRLKPETSSKTKRGPSLPLFLKQRKKAKIVLSDGSVYEGFAVGAEATRLGEFVFHTGHSGYQEILTDPSYRKQIIVFSASHIGNQGVHLEDYESRRIWAEACVMRNYSSGEGHWKNKQSLHDFLVQQKIPGIVGVDTRRLILKLRDHGSLWGLVSTEKKSVKELQSLLKPTQQMEGLSLTKEVSTKTSYEWVTKSVPLMNKFLKPLSSNLRRCIVVDFGVKRQMLRYLLDVGFEEVIVVPSSIKAEEILAQSPDCLLLSNGPGDPSAEQNAIHEVRQLLGKFPIFGICLGHQILALALGMKTMKMKFGHHAANHPVKNLRKNFVEITSQNHGFAVDPDSVGEDIEITHLNMNDQSVAGFVHKKMPICGIQFHPEASPGPADSVELFQQFRAGSFQ